ncbi:hypothetical protein ACIBVL_15825 [Streptomyces sp. NPDC049687]|uniref:hypothetical protein n=1 Tax=Streptomyces sp. NPDC049687 TaxID=3365596 RepID=UPI003792A19A
MLATLTRRTQRLSWSTGRDGLGVNQQAQAVGLIHHSPHGAIGIALSEPAPRRAGAADGLGIGRGAVTAHDLDARMHAQPRFQRLVTVLTPGMLVLADRGFRGFDREIVTPDRREAERNRTCHDRHLAARPTQPGG